jgi:hypothetical protein
LETPRNVLLFDGHLADVVAITLDEKKHSMDEILRRGCTCG